MAVNMALVTTKEINKEIGDEIKLSWIQHPYTSRYVKELSAKRLKLLEACENLSVTTPVDIDRIKINLVKCKQLKEEIEYANKICQ